MEKDNLVREFDTKAKMPTKKTWIIIGVVAVAAGVLSGYVLNSSLGKENIKRDADVSEIESGLTVGVADEETFRDSAEGTLEKGGIDGEGSHHLVRPGGDSQTVYLTSSIVDLDKFTGRKVKVWGETFAAQKAGWLMDVGKLKILE